MAYITINGKSKSLGCFDDEKEAACKYDEQAALLNKPVNFPQHEGQEQAAKQASKGSPVWRLKTGKSQAKSSKDDDDDDEEEAIEDEWNSDEANDDDEEMMIIQDENSEASSSSSTSSSLLALQQRLKQEEVDDTSIDAPDTEVSEADSTQRYPSRFHEARDVKIEENLIDGVIKCPRRECKNTIFVKEGGCNRIACLAHRPFMYFCYHCKTEIDDDSYCKNGCRKRNDKSARQEEQCKRNKRAENDAEDLTGEN